MKRVEKAVPTPFPGKIYYVDETASTMNLARELAEKKEADHGSLFQAGIQTAGRGRIPDRVWESERGLNLLFTILLRREKLSIPVSAFPLAVGLSVSLLLEKRGLNPSIKWPNDILCGNRKISGILCETVGNFLSAGIGLNCNQQRFSPVSGREPVSISVLSGGPVDIDSMLAELLTCLHQVVDDSGWCENINARLFRRGTRVVLSEGAAESGNRLKGTILGIGTRGELLFEDSFGKVRSMFSGEILYD